MIAGYREDLAAIHDDGFAELANEAAALLIPTLSRARLSRGTVTDLGCGGGRLLRRVADAGYEAVGVDLSAAAIELARNRVPEARLRVGSFLSFPLPRSVAITAIGEVLCYAFDERNTNSARAALFERAHAALAPGGVLLFDLATASGASVLTRRGSKTGQDWAVDFESWIDEHSGLLVRRIATARRTGGAWRRDEEVHRLRLADPETVVRTLRAIGFAVRTLSGYGASALPPGVVAFLATRLAGSTGVA